MKASDNVFPQLIAAEGAAPATPAAGTVVMYAKTDGLLYSKDDAGAETALGGGAGAVASVNGATGVVVLDGGDIGITDTGGYFTATDVEGALQELGAGGGGAVSSVNGATGAVVLDDGDVKSVVTALTSGTTVTVDCSLGRNFTLTLGHNVGTLTLTNLAGAGFVTEGEIEIKQPSSGGPYTFALPASFKALGGSDTAIATAASSATLLSFKTFDNGTTYRYAMQESA